MDPNIRRFGRTRTGILVVGAGSTELSDFRYPSGLLLKSGDHVLAVDISPRNALGIVRILHTPTTAFAVTHPHSDHFDPEIPWREVFDHKFVPFGTENNTTTHDVVLFVTPQTFEYIVWYNGIPDSQIRKRKYGAIVKNLETQRRLVVRFLDFNKQYKWGDITFKVIDANHPWRMPPGNPVIEGHTVGFVFKAPFNTVYLPDFSFSKELIVYLLRWAKAIKNRGRLIFGVTTPLSYETSTAHATLEEVKAFIKQLPPHVEVYFTHLNPSWYGYTEEIGRVKILEPFSLIKI